MIRQLPLSVQSQIRSGITITSVTQCVEELLLNAVDASSRCIAVRIDLSCFRIQVVDNGTGITADQLDKIGQRYSTSKCHTVEDLESLSQFGYRGEALASICDISYILEVTSRARCCAQTYCKIFQQGKSLETVESKVHRPSPGTTIIVHNLFYNFPVRQKSISATLEMENICHRIEALALMQPTLSITLRNDITGSVLLQTHKTNSPLVTFSYLFNHSKAQSLVSVSNSFGYFCIKGYIAKESHYRKDLQFIYINKRLVLKTHLHKLVNSILKKSLIVRQHQALYIAEKLSPSKQAGKYPVFILNIQCPLNTYDITFDPKKTMVEFEDWATLSAGVEEMCKEFLHKENLLTVDCLFSEEKNENDNLSQEVNLNEDTNKLLMSNYEQIVFDKIDDEMFNHIQTRCLKSGLIKRLFEKNHSTENQDSEQYSANKKCKTEKVSDEKETTVSSDNINFQNISAPRSVSTSGFSDSQPGELKLSASQENVSCVSNSLPHQNFTLVQDTILESEKIPFQESVTDVSTQVVGAYSSKCKTKFLEEGSDLSRIDLFRSNYINEKLNCGKDKQILVDNNQKESGHQMYQTVSIQSEKSGCSNKNVPFTNEKLPPKQENYNKSQNNSFNLPFGRNFPSLFRNCKRNLKEVASVKTSQSTRSILDHFRAPHHKRETGESAVQKIKPDLKTLLHLKKRCCINVDLQKSSMKSVDSEEDICSKELHIPLRSHQSNGIIHPHCKSLSVKDNEMLVKLLNQKSSKKSLASKLSNLYKNNNIKSCKPSKTEMMLTTISAGQNEKCKSVKENEKKSSQSHLENQTMDKDLSNLNPKIEMFYDYRKTVKEEFTSLEEYCDGIVKSVPSFELVNPLLNFDSVLNKNNNPEALVCRQNLESPEKLVRKKRQFLCSSAFLKTLPNNDPQNAEREASQKKECNKRSLKDFDSDYVECFSEDRHDNYNHLGSSHRTECYQMHENACSKDENERDCYHSSRSTQLSWNKPSFNQSCSDQDKNLSSEEFFTESLQLAPSFSTNFSVEKPILSLDFSSDSESLQNLQHNTKSKINFELYNNFDEGTRVCERKQSNDTFLTTTWKEINLRTEKFSLVETQENLAELENILKKRDQILSSPVFDINFNKEKIVTEEHILGNPGVVINVSDSKTEEAIGKDYSTSLIQPSLSSSYEKETCTQYSEEQETNQKSIETCEYLNEAPKILIDTLMSNKTPETSSKSFKMLAETSEVSRGCPQMSSSCKILNDTSEKFEEICQISNETSGITNLTPEALNKISEALSDTCKTMNDAFEVSDDFKSPVSNPEISNNAHKIIFNTSETTRNIQNSYLPNSQCNTAFFERTTDQSVLVPNITFLSNEKSAVNIGFNVYRNSLPTSSTLLSTKSLPSLLLKDSSQKTNSQWDDISVSTRQDSLLRKTNDFIHFLVKQAQRSPSVSSASESAVKGLMRVCHGDDLESNKNPQQFERECASATSSQEQIMKIWNFGENSRHSWIHPEIEIQPVSNSFSKEVDISKNVEKLSEISNSTMKCSSDSKSLEPSVISKSSAFSKLEKPSHDLASSQAYVGVCINSYNIHLMKNIDHFENSGTMLLQDVVPAKKTTCRPSTSTTSDLNLNKIQQSDENFFKSNFKASEDLEMESTQNSLVKNESYLQNLIVGCNNEDKKENDPEIAFENETDFTVKLWRNWKNPVFQVNETDVLDIWTNHSMQQKLHRVTHSCQFTKAMLSQMEAIGQVDNKFIACIVKSQNRKSEIPDYLLMIDQHAAHERVRLEQLTADMYQLEYNGESEKLTVKFSQIFPPWTLSLSDKEMRIVSFFLDEFSKIGLQLKIQQDNIIEIHTAPSCIMAREASERRYNRNTVAFDLVQALIKEKIELLHDTHGAHSTLPKTIHDLLCSQSCHGAIKFNDPLTLAECQNLLKMLLKCKLPFQCAHGRPSVVPLVNLQHLKWILTEPDPPKVNLKKLLRQMEEQKK